MITFLQAGQWYAIQVGFDQLWELNTISSFFASAGISQFLSALVVKKISRWLWTAPHIISSLQYGHLIILPPFVNLLLVYYSFQNSWSYSTSTFTISDRCIAVCKWWFFVWFVWENPDFPLCPCGFGRFCYHGVITLFTIRKITHCTIKFSQL